MDAYHATKSGEIRSMSFAFNMPEDGSGELWDDYEDEETGERCAKRTLLDCEDLSDVAFCTTGTGAYDSAFCDARSLFPNGTSPNVEVRSAWGISGALKPNKYRNLTTEQLDEEMNFLRRMAVNSLKF
jgi:phage head maturation protease